MKYLMIIVGALLVLTFANTGCEKTEARTLQRSAIVRLLDPQSGRFFCSGTVISDKHVLTAAHCVDGFMEVVVQEDAKRSHKVAGTPKPTREPFDVAIIEGDFKDFTKGKMVIDPNEIIKKLNKTLVTCGYPMGGELLCNRFEYTNNWIFMFAGKAFLWPGMSGGPVFDAQTGEIIAVNTAVNGADALISPTIELWKVLDIEQ